MSKVIQNHQKSLYIIYSILSISILSFLSINNTYADESSNLNYSVTVEPALNITTSSNKVSLDLNPLNHDFDSQNLTVSVSTNNETGYKLHVNATNDKLVEKDDDSLYIETLSSETPENNFTVNRWGYRIGSGNYLPFESGILLNSSKTQIENNSSTLTFAAKVGYETKAGTYNLALNFQATANPHIYYIQDFTNTQCAEYASSEAITLIDERDDKDYKVRYINGNCWMVQNLRYIGDTGSTSGYMVMKKETSNIEADTTISYRDLTVGDNNYSQAELHVATSDQVPFGATLSDVGVWYNFAAASAMTIIGNSNTIDATYDICPAGWQLPIDQQYRDILTLQSTFDPVSGGWYKSGSNDQQAYGYWWTKTTFSDPSHASTHRYALDYYSSYMSVGMNFRYMGYYIRCVRSS